VSLQRLPRECVAYIQLCKHDAWLWQPPQDPAAKPPPNRRPLWLPLHEAAAAKPPEDLHRVSSSQNGHLTMSCISIVSSPGVKFLCNHNKASSCDDTKTHLESTCEGTAHVDVGNIDMPMLVRMRWLFQAVERWEWKTTRTSASYRRATASFTFGGQHKHAARRLQ
jgi:hypothetical protein